MSNTDPEGRVPPEAPGRRGARLRRAPTGAGQGGERPLLAVDGDFSPQSNLIESGLDSLAVTQLMLAIEEATGVWTDESLLTPENLETAETLAASIYEHVARG